MSLDVHAEVLKLARELQTTEDRLEGLEVVAAEDLRRLRRLVGDALHDAHRHAFERAAAASALLPTPLTAKLAQTLIGPYLAARIAAEMPPERSVKLASHLEIDFLADVCLALDPARVASTVSALPDDRVIAVGLELLARHEYVTLGKFVDVVRPTVITHMTDRITDPAALLRVATAIEARHRLDDLMGLVDDARLTAMVAQAVEDDFLAATLVLMTHLGPETRRRLAGLVAGLGEDVLDRVAAVAHAEGAWADVLPLLAAIDEDHLPMAVNVPTTADAEVLRAIVEAVATHDLWDDLLPIVVHLDDHRIAVLAEADDLLSAGLVVALVQAVLPRPALWGPLVRTFARVPDDHQHALARRLRDTDGVDVDSLGRLLSLVPEARGLPLLAALREEGA